MYSRLLSLTPGQVGLRQLLAHLQCVQLAKIMSLFHSKCKHMSLTADLFWETSTILQRKDLLMNLGTQEKGANPRCTN